MVWGDIYDRLKQGRWWRVVEPFALALGSLFATTTLIYGVIDTWYGYRPPPLQFVQSHIFLQILLAHGCLLVVVGVFSATSSRTTESLRGVRLYIRANPKATVIRLASILLAMFAATAGVLRLSPARANRIRVLFFESPTDFQKEAFLYLVYELNRIQSSWYFDVDWNEWSLGLLDSELADYCRTRRDVALCFSEVRHYGRAPSDDCLRSPGDSECYEQTMTDRDPLIVVTSRELGGGAYFATHRARAGAISTFDKAGYEPLTVYEHLMYNLLVQTISLHLNTHGGEHENAFRRGATSRGSVSEYDQGLTSFKARILAGRLTPEQERTLFNRFGPGYVAACTELLTLDWLHSEKVTTNLRRAFGVELAANPRP